MFCVCFPCSSLPRTDLDAYSTENGTDPRVYNQAPQAEETTYHVAVVSLRQPAKPTGLGALTPLVSLIYTGHSGSQGRGDFVSSPSPLFCIFHD